MLYQYGSPRNAGGLQFPSSPTEEMDGATPGDLTLGGGHVYLNGAQKIRANDISPTNAPSGNADARPKAINNETLQRLEEEAMRDQQLRNEMAKVLGGDEDDGEAGSWNRMQRKKEARRKKRAQKFEADDGNVTGSADAGDANGSGAPATQRDSPVGDDNTPRVTPVPRQTRTGIVHAPVVMPGVLRATTANVAPTTPAAPKLMALLNQQDGTGQLRADPLSPADSPAAAEPSGDADAELRELEEELMKREKRISNHMGNVLEVVRQAENRKKINERERQRQDEWNGKKP
eukprot:TRINITY_DN5371_c0_g1_i1.p1 TRINITY_DN5371_c0_g1~~TRINITY_DN5371_c0_g1_i1.p1  ORF type:complete len:290 (-),score=51.94 TRINITY_DN5371_c0_g1_i1:371-1240(-)